MWFFSSQIWTAQSQALVRCHQEEEQQDEQQQQQQHLPFFVHLLLLLHGPMEEVKLEVLP